MGSAETVSNEDAVDALQAALDTLVAEDPSFMTREQLGRRSLALQLGRQRLDGVIALNIAEADRAGVAVNAGQRTMAQYLASRSHASPDAIRADTRIGSWVGQFALFQDAMLAGDLSRQHIDLLRRTENIRVHAAMQRDQQLLIGFVATLEWAGFKNAVKYWLMVNDQDGPEPKDHEADNTCTASTRADGRVLVSALTQLAKGPEEQDFTSGLDANDIDGRCELIDGTPIHPKYALILMMNARIRRQVLTPKSKTLNASEEVRLFPKWMKHIRLVETRGQCETAGCDAPHQWLQGDHTKPFTKTQQTTLDNLTMLCAPDNKHKTDGPPLAERTAPSSRAADRVAPD